MQHIFLIKAITLSAIEMYEKHILDVRMFSAEFPSSFPPPDFTERAFVTLFYAFTLCLNFLSRSRKLRVRAFPYHRGKGERRRRKKNFCVEEGKVCE